MDKAHVLQCVFNQTIFLFAFDPKQLPAFRASKKSRVAYCSNRQAVSNVARSFLSRTSQNQMPAPLLLARSRCGLCPMAARHHHLKIIGRSSSTYQRSGARSSQTPNYLSTRRCGRAFSISSEPISYCQKRKFESSSKDSASSPRIEP